MKQEMNFYDEDFKVAGDTYNSGAYETRNIELSKTINSHDVKRIVEFAGCEGNLAKHILENDKIEKYYFSDFSLFAIMYAKDILWGDNRVFFEQIDADRQYTKLHGMDYDTFVCTSFEHLENDLKIINILKPGTMVFLSLPNFDTKGHVRFFRNREDIIDRYSFFMDIIEIKEMRHSLSSTVLMEWVRGWLFDNKYSYFLHKIQGWFGITIEGNRKKFNVVAKRNERVML